MYLLYHQHLIKGFNSQGGHANTHTDANVSLIQQFVTHLEVLHLCHCFTLQIK